MEEIKNIVNLQFDVNQQKNLLFDDLAQLFQADPDFISSLRQIKEGGDLHYYESKLDELIAYAVQQLVEEIYSINQFIHISPERQKEAENIYRDSWEMMKTTDDLEVVLYDFHYPRLSDWLSTLYPSHFTRVLQNQPRLNRIVCKEYSPELQSEILRLNANPLLPPLLDIGCGENGYLVKHLRNHQVQAFGFDRLQAAPEPFLAKDDWFGYEYGNGYWGTIISNAALSNHIRFAANHDHSLLARYQKLFQTILNSLKPGGSFIYAPDVPMLEVNINHTDYVVEKRPISHGLYMTRVRKLAL